MKSDMDPIKAKDLLLEYGFILPDKGGARTDEERGMEAIVGMTRDRELGPIVTFGLAGVFAFIKDVSTRVAPITNEDALEMIKETRAYDILKGASDTKKRDINAVADVIAKVSKLAMERGEIAQIEINPLYVYEDGVTVGEARIAVE